MNYPGNYQHGKSSIIFENIPGRHCYEFTIDRGRLRLSHHWFNPDGFTWTYPPTDGNQEYYDMEEKGVFRFLLYIGVSEGKADRIKFVNANLWKAVDVKYRID